MSEQIVPEPTVIGVALAALGTLVALLAKFVKGIKLCDEKALKDAMEFIDRIQADNNALRNEQVTMRAEMLLNIRTISDLRRRLDDQDTIIHAMKNEIQRYKLASQLHELRDHKDEGQDPL